jgi:hypothetical protein
MTAQVDVSPPHTHRGPPPPLTPTPSRTCSTRILSSFFPASPIAAVSRWSCSRLSCPVRMGPMSRSAAATASTVGMPCVPQVVQHSTAQHSTAIGVECTAHVRMGPTSRSAEATALTVGMPCGAHNVQHSAARNSEIKCARFKHSAQQKPPLRS